MFTLYLFNKGEHFFDNFRNIIFKLRGSHLYSTEKPYGHDVGSRFQPQPAAPNLEKYVDRDVMRVESTSAVRCDCAPRLNCANLMQLLCFMSHMKSVKKCKNVCTEELKIQHLNEYYLFTKITLQMHLRCY